MDQAKGEEYSYWGFTVRKCSNIKSYKALKGLFEKYKSVMRHLRQQGAQDVEYHYEIVYPPHGKSVNVHIHGMYKAEPIHCPSVKRIPGYIMHLMKLNAKRHWQQYITKQNLDEADVEQEIYEYYNQEHSDQDEDVSVELENDIAPPRKRLF